MNLNLAGVTKPTEVDLLYLMNGEIGVGEAKRSASLFTEDLIAADLANARRIGATSYFMGCGEKLARQTLAFATASCLDMGLRLVTMEGADGAWAQRAHIPPGVALPTG